jgi:3-hydroxyisobutyrate dehydrogenase-like beta-hydroxyacid dehydrogenase
MGSRMAARLIDAGNAVYGTNRTRGKAQPLIDRGMTWMHTPREVAATADFTFSMVSDDDALASIADGPDGVLAALAPGKVFIDMSTVSPRTSAAMSARVRSLGARMLDAPVSGSTPQAESGTLMIMVGGGRSAFAAVETLLRELGQTVTHIGPNGQGLLVKLAINISLAVQTLAFSEGLLLLERGGVDPELAAQVLSASAIGSPMLRARVPLLLNLPEHAWFDIALMHKDIRLARDTGEGLGAPLPSAALADEMLTRASELGYGHRDIAAFHEVLEQTAAEPRIANPASSPDTDEHRPITPPRRVSGRRP